MGNVDEYRDIIGLCADMSLSTEEVHFFGLLDAAPCMEATEDRVAEQILDKVFIENTYNKGGLNYVYC